MLRDYQREALGALGAFWRESPRGVPLIVAPTGSGKSVILSELCRKALAAKPQYKIWVVTHRKELIEQNSRELYNLLKIPIGIYSAGLGIKTVRSVTCAGIQSIFKKKIYADLVIVDEAHLIGPNDDSMYQKFIDNCFAGNGGVKFVGLTATPYRMNQGSLVGGFFTDICYDIEVRKLIEDGWLSTLISKPRGNVDFSNVARVGFDFKQSELEAKMSPLVMEHCKEILTQAQGRKSILIFCSGIKHAKDVAAFMRTCGETAEDVNGEMLSMQRDLIVERFKNGTTRILTNCDILTTGFNYPRLDCIALLRATRSTGLYVQIVGRGMRIADGKPNCLILDFGGNVDRHGPIDCIVVKARNKKDKVDVARAPTKECPKCGAVWGIRVLECTCGHMFSVASTIEPKATIAPIISEAEVLDVQDVTLRIHNKIGKPPSVRIDYICGLRVVSDFLCFEHGGYASAQAQKKWSALGGLPIKRSQEALGQQIKKPSQIEVIKQGGFYRVLKCIGELKKEDNNYFHL